MIGTEQVSLLGEDTRVQLPGLGEPGLVTEDITEVEAQWSSCLCSDWAAAGQPRPPPSPPAPSDLGRELVRLFQVAAQPDVPDPVDEDCLTSSLSEAMATDWVRCGQMS